MDNAQLYEAATAEFAFLCTKLTTDELRAVDRRAVEGTLEGTTYVLGGCACLYGSIAVERGIVSPDGEDFDVEKIESLIGDLLEGSGTDDFGGTPMEEILYNVYQGDTVLTNPVADWLHGLIAAELERREVATMEVAQAVEASR